MSSKIKVDTIENVAGSGNVSLGSGHNLVVPGTLAITGATTLGSNLTVDTNTLFVDATNNKVAIGTTSPNTTAGAALLQINKDGEALRIDGSANTAREIFFRGVGTSNVASIHSDGSLKIRAEDSGTHIEFHTADTLAMNIDSGGRVTKPLTPFVRLSLTSHVSANTTVNAPGNQVTGFTVRENVGSYWNSSNNNFTCPVAGVYQVSVFFIKYPVGGTAHLDLHKNGSIVNEVRWRAPEAGSSYYQAGGTVSVTCAANDVLDWHYFGQAGIHDGNGSWEIMLSH